MSTENLSRTATLTAGLDVGSGAVKAVIMGFEEGREELLAKISTRIRRRDISSFLCNAFIRKRCRSKSNTTNVRT